MAKSSSTARRRYFARAAWTTMCAAFLTALSLAGAANAAESTITGGAKGMAPYPDFARITSLTTPDVSAAGFFVVFSLTRAICGGAGTTGDDLAAVAPEGFAIARGDVHSLGFEAPVWDGDYWAISVTGDSEKDEAGHHPYWLIRYGADGRATRCSMTWAPDPAGVSEDERRHVVHWLFVGVPQLFSAIMIEPRFGGLHWPIEAEAMTLVRACPAGWCPMTVIPLMSTAEWSITVDLPLGEAAR